MSLLGNMLGLMQIATLEASLARWLAWTLGCTSTRDMVTNTSERWLAWIHMPSFKMALVETCPFGPVLVGTHVVCK